jgi:hypothetical protein
MGCRFVTSIGMATHTSVPAPVCSNSKSRVDVFCALTHSAKTLVRIALSLNGFGITSAAIVTNEHAQEVAQASGRSIRPAG